MLTWSLCLVGAYLLGSIPFGFLIGRSRGVDIRLHGSGNVGATNVGRLLGRGFGLTCFVLDAAKGAVSVIVAGMINGVWGRSLTGGAEPLAAGEAWPWLAVVVAALLGHMYSPWLGFRGGKGVATGFGGMIAMWPLLTIPSLAALALWLVVALSTRFISLSSMIAAASMPLTCAAVAAGPAWLDDGGPDVATRLCASAPIIISTAALAVFVLVKHRANIGRLKRGDEPRWGKKESDQATRRPGD